MAESVDALVSNTSGATHPGSIPGLGTETEKVEKLSPFSLLPQRNSLVCGYIKSSTCCSFWFDIYIPIIYNTALVQGDTLKQQKFLF